MNKHLSQSENLFAGAMNAFSIMPAKMLGEVRKADTSGVSISVGKTIDQAYDNPEKIQEIYNLLDRLGGEFEVHHKVARHVAQKRLWQYLFPETQSQKHRRLKIIDRHLEPHRARLLYDSHEGGPWHQQRGSATALLTISIAHDLNAPHSSGIYKMMSGPLDETIVDYTFDDRCESLSGLSLSEAIVKTEMEFNHRSRDNAASYADHKLAKLQQFVHAKPNDRFKQVVQYCTDSLGIRSRGQEVSAAIEDHIINESRAHSECKEPLIMSFGCGTALPILTTMKNLKESHRVNTRVILLYQDPIALAAAAQLADKMGLSGSIEMYCYKLFRTLGQPVDMKPILKGRKLDVYEDSGLREYLPDHVYTALTFSAWRSLARNGLMTTGNMNTHRPQAEFVGGLMGWIPHVQKRTIKQGIRLHKRARVPLSAIRVRVTQDGVYTLYFSSRKFIGTYDAEK